MEYNRKTTIDDRIADCERKVADLNARIERLKQVKATWENLPFSEGDAAFHTQYGNVLISGIDYSIKDDEVGDIKYKIMTKNGIRYSVSFTELTEITTATKLLYGKK